ncbi:MAG: class I SAM-dependent methyltransferase [Lachnospiraceae bacterium]|nr:class I SAM-dependent methyltransferase [Lachnospiraceae bacterium]
MTPIEQYYNKFNEEKRLLHRHGQVEYHVTMHYIKMYLEKLSEHTEPSAVSVIDIGAGTGRYAVALSELGYDVTAVELVKYNLGILKQKQSNVKAYQGNALSLKRFADDSFDLALLFGPMYHLLSFEEKKRALAEAKRVVKPKGYIMVAYCMNEYSILTYGFKENHIVDCMDAGKITEDFRVCPTEEDLYDYVRLEEIEQLNCAVGLTRERIFSPDGPADYMRPILNAMDEQTFRLFIEYQLKNCERRELLGAGSHIVDVLIKMD